MIYLVNQNVKNNNKKTKIP